MIEVRDLRKVYRTGDIAVEALRGVSFTIRNGEFAAIMGPSGSGKSTLMHLIGCLDQATSGTYRLNGVDVGQLSDDDLAGIRNREIGFVFQQFNLLSRTTAWRNVEVPLIYAGTGRSERRSRAREMLERVGLGHRLQHRTNEVSGGERQRIAIARALVNDPSLILADEPTGNLDTVTGEEIMGIFEDLHRQGHTIIVVTHESIVADRAQRRIDLRDGQVESDEVSG